jgi:hypothetical protein
VIIDHNALLGARVPPQAARGQSLLQVLVVAHPGDLRALPCPLRQDPRRRRVELRRGQRRRQRPRRSARHQAGNKIGIYTLRVAPRSQFSVRSRSSLKALHPSRSCAGDPRRDEEPADEEAVQVRRGRGLADAASVVELCFRLVVHPARSKNRPRHGVKSQDVHVRRGGGNGRGGGGGSRRWGLRRGRRERGLLLREELPHAQHEPSGDRGVVGVHADRPARDEPCGHVRARANGHVRALT